MAQSTVSRKSPGDAPQEKVQALSKMIKELESQTERLLAINEAVEKDRDQERKARRALERKVAELEERVAQADQIAFDAEDQATEIEQLQAERTKLASTVERLTRELADVKSELKSSVRLVEQLRAGRQDSLLELQNVEAQFERAMEIVSELRTRITVLGEERQAIAVRAQVIEDKLREVEAERDALQVENEESQKALQEIRRSLTDAYLKQVTE